MIDDELTQLLRELVAATGATGAAVVHDRPAAQASDEPATSDAGGETIAVPLGGGAELEVRFAAAPRQDADGRPLDRRAAIDRSARAVRACARRWQVAPGALPAICVPPAAPAQAERVLGRIADFLRAFSGAHGVANAVVTLRGAPIASAAPLSELESARLPFVLRQVAAEAERSAGTSHGEIAGDDVYATSFWFGACLVAFFARPYAQDFVRHRARLVTREVALLLPLLDEPPPAPANTAPIPE